jgi:microcystin degradation protein MlrC
MTYRIALASIYHESNTFSNRVTDLASFRAKCWAIGEDLRTFFAGTRTVVGGFIDGAAEAGLTLVPIVGALATPSGPVSSEALKEIATQLSKGLEAQGPFDGALVELHGSMVSRDYDTPELELLRLVRRELGERPIVVVLDMHTNLSPAMLAVVDVAVGYKTNPHVDTYDRGTDAAHILRRVLDRCVRPISAYVRVPVIAPAISQRTDAEPLQSIMEKAAQLRTLPGIIEVNVHCGFTYADVPHLGMAISVIADSDPELASRSASELGELVWTLRRSFVAARSLSSREAVRSAVVAASTEGGPVVIADTGDNINGGGSGDGTWLIREAVAQTDVRALGTVWDPDVVTIAGSIGVGGPIRCEVGGKNGPLSGAPVAIDGEVLWIGDGEYRRLGPMAAGALENMGRSAVIRTRTVDLVVQGHPIQPNDPAQFIHCGLEPSQYGIVMLKGAAAVRAGWRGVARQFVEASTPGFTDSILQRLPFTRISRPLWPFDEEFSYGGTVTPSYANRRFL